MSFHPFEKPISNRIELVLKVGHGLSKAGRNYSVLGNVLAECVYRLGN